MNRTVTLQIGFEAAKLLLEESKRKLAAAEAELSALQQMVSAHRQTVRALEASLRPPAADGSAPSPASDAVEPTPGRRARAGENRDRLAEYLRLNGPAPVPKAREEIGMADSSIRVTIAKHPDWFRTREDGCVELVNHQLEPQMNT